MVVGNDRGGSIVAQGGPEDLARMDAGLGERALKEFFHGNHSMAVVEVDRNEDFALAVGQCQAEKIAQRIGGGNDIFFTRLFQQRSPHHLGRCHQAGHMTGRLRASPAQPGNLFRRRVNHRPQASESGEHPVGKPGGRSARAACLQQQCQNFCIGEHVRATTQQFFVVGQGMGHRGLLAGWAAGWPSYSLRGSRYNEILLRSPCALRPVDLHAVRCWGMGVSVLSGKRILLGVTGGVAAYKAAVLARLLIRLGAQLTVVMTASAQRFVTPASFQALTGNRVHVDMWDERIADGMGHIELSRVSDFILVAPATTDFIARLAQGRADDLLAALCVARACPLWIAPAMNRQMWLHPATVRNVETITADGVRLLGPDAGVQACGEVGFGRMLEPEHIVAALEALLLPGGASPESSSSSEGLGYRLAGLDVLITAGPTFEPIDTVRGLTNRSSGKMGYAIAAAAQTAGARVTLVSGPTALSTPAGVTRLDVTTACEMFDAVMARAGAADVFIGVAAVADYRVAKVAAHKLKKTGVPPVLELVENPDILATVAALPDAPFCVGFAAETEDLHANAQAKRRRKQVPLLAANLAQEAFGRDDNALTLFDDAGEHVIARASKPAVARALLAHVAHLIGR